MCNIFRSTKGLFIAAKFTYCFVEIALHKHSDITGTKPRLTAVVIPRFITYC